MKHINDQTGLSQKIATLTGETSFRCRGFTWRVCRHFSFAQFNVIHVEFAFEATFRPRGVVNHLYLVDYRTHTAYKDNVVFRYESTYR